MQKLPLITVGISFYNSEPYLALAINSVINQSFEDWELVLIDDGSTDGSLNIAKNYEQLDQRIRVISDGQNRKLPARLNQVIEEAKGKYIARMDADDLIHPDRLKVQLEFLETNQQFDLVSSGLVSIDNKNKAYGYRQVDSLYTDFSEVKETYPIAHATVLAKKTWYKRNKYNPNYPRSQDYELWCRTASQKDLNIAVLPDLLYYYREEGVLEAHKLISSYKVGLEIYSKYHSEFKLKKTLKNKTKKAVVTILNKFNMLQKLAKFRNQKNVSSEILNCHQNILNNIIKLTK